MVCCIAAHQQCSRHSLSLCHFGGHSLFSALKLLMHACAYICSQVKHAAPGSGFGGDWAVRVHAMARWVEV